MCYQTLYQNTMYNLENKQKIIDLLSLIINIEERKQHNPGEIFALTEIKLYNKFSIIICKVYKILIIYLH